ncbi:MAG: BrnA antitoxin family protein [Pseudolabrys sp.]|nr:BrnA antitoxin family protein [Pseudolabrys sp.]MCW5697656.1 BrnA antitoxin family protein [Bauldia sp.]
MAQPPERRLTRTDPRAAAEAAFKSPAARSPLPAERPPTPAGTPAPRETVSLRIDRDVLEHFQADGPGWQDRINAALRKAAGT